MLTVRLFWLILNDGFVVDDSLPAARRERNRREERERERERESDRRERERERERALEREGERVDKDERVES